MSFVEFLAGISPLVCKQCKTLEEVMLFALEIMDVQNTDHVSQDKLEMLLKGKMV